MRRSRVRSSLVALCESIFEFLLGEFIGLAIPVGYGGLVRSMSKPLSAIFLTVLMFTSLASAGISSWNGNSTLSGTNDSVNDAFQVPGNATVIDAWLHVDESGYLEDGSGTTWGIDSQSNLSSGMMNNTTTSKFSGALSLAPDSAVSNVETFSSAVLQFSSVWSHTGSIWAPSNPSTLGGTVSGPTRTLSHGNVPAAASSGAVVAATLPGQGLPAGSAGTLVSPSVTIPSPINYFNLTFAHWHHLDTTDGAWVEYKLDSGNWTYLEPNGGYPHTISNNSSTPNGVNTSGFGVYGDGNHSGWSTALFNLDNLTGIQNATDIQFRFLVWTDSNSTSRPGWFIDDIELNNVGNSSGFWHHGCYSTTASCSYSNNAEGVLETDVNLSGTTSGSKIQTHLEWDLEGSTYDNFCIEMSSNNGTTWTDISSSGSNGSTATSCRSRTGAIPGSGYTLPNGTFVGDESGGFVTLEFAIPTSMIGVNNSTKIRYFVQTDSSVQYGSPNDNLEGLTVDWFKVIDSNGTALATYDLDTSTTATHYGNNNAADDWSFILIGQGGMTVTDDFEDSPALPPGAWSVQNVAGQTGWEFGALCSNYTDGPSSYPSANLGFATNQCGDYDGSSDNSLITPQYYVPLGASARFVWKHWMCSEDGWDGGALYVSVNNGSYYQAYVSQGNGSNWYDGQITGGTTFIGMDVWDGRQYVASSGAFSCSGATIPWVNMSYDVSNLSGSNVSFKFRQVSDSIINEPGWYVDDIGLEVDWFLTEGNWMSPLISPHDLGYGFVDADIYLPNSTWYGINVKDSSGNIIPGHENMSLPLSLASIDRDAYASGIYIELMLGTSDEYYTPIVRALSVGATRYLGDSNGWSIPSSITRLSNGSWQNNVGTTQMIAGSSGYSSRPISAATVLGEFNQTTVSLLTSGIQTVSVNSPNSTLNLGGMKNFISPQISLAPNAIVESIAIQGHFAQPAHDASIDLANDGTVDWAFPADPSYGSLGWQTRINELTTTRSFSSTGSDSFSIIVPEEANIESIMLGITPLGNVAPLNISSGSTSLYQLTGSNWSSTVFMISNPILHSPSNMSDTTGRIWNVYDIDVTNTGTQYVIGSVSVGYTLLENVSGLGQVVKSYHELNSNNGQVSIVDVPLTWAASAGGAGIDGGVYHENMITNHPFTVPQTWYPNGQVQSFTTQHHHLYGNENIDEIHLTGTDLNGEIVEIILSDIQSGGSFTQNDGLGILNLNSNSSVSEVNGRLVVDWMFDVDWDWDDVQSMSWSAQAYDENGEGLSPATATSGGTGTQASENDLLVDTWTVMDLYGHELSDMFSPSYPFWAMAGSKVSVSGNVKFENTANMRPLVNDFVVAVDVDGTSVIMNSTSSGQWTGLVTLPTNTSLVDLTPYIIRVGPIQGANGAQDATLTTPVSIQVDDESPWVSNLQVNTGQKLVDADGFTWDPSSTLSLQVTITDNQALGSELVMHTWREGMDDSNGDGIADLSEYQSITKTLPEGVSGERTISFSGIDVSGLAMNAKFSVFFTSNDYAGLPLMYGGDAGLDSDMGTLVIAVNEPTNIPQSGLTLDSIDEQLLAGQVHTLTMEISDLNGINSIDVITVNMLGQDEDVKGVMTWEPRNGQIYTPENSQITLHEVVENIDDGFSTVDWHFSLDWNFPAMANGEYGLPSIIVFDDDDLNPVTVLTNIGELRWQLDNNLEIVVENIVDNTPPISSSSPYHVYVQPGDDLTVSGIIQYEVSGVQIESLPEDGLEVLIETYYGSELLVVETDVNEDGTWTTGLILPSRSLNDGLLTVSYSILGVVAPGEDASLFQSMITVDDVRPVVQFSSVPLTLDDEDLELLQFSLQIIDAGGMPQGDLIVNWAFLRNGLIMQNGQSSASLPFVSENAAIWTYAGTLDFTEGVNVSLEEGDELIWWIDVVDRAGNEGKGTGLSMIDAMNTDFTILSVEVTVTNIEITLADGSIPKANQVVEGEELGITVQLRNLGTKEGTISVTLYEDMGPERTWLAHETQEVILYPGQTKATLPLLFETYKDGAQNIYVNITGMDVWLDNTQLPHCVGFETSATCDLGVESDMPRVISQDSAESSSSGMIFTISILAILLIASGFAITVLIRRQNGAGDSIFFEDEDENQWDDSGISETKFTPAIPEDAVPQSVPESSAPAEVAQSPEQPSEGPPLPESGLPDGWTMEQWNHYGHQWLENNQ